MPKPNLEEFITTHKSQVNRRLAALLKQEMLAAQSTNQAHYDLLKHLAVLANRGGKRLRPLLFLLSYQGYGGTNKSAALQVAVSQELLHTFLLIHDDVIDRDFQRWGGRNLLGIYFEQFSKTMEAREALHLAEAQAILAGDTCFALANQTLLTSNFDSKRLLRAAAIQQQTVQQVIAGEVAETQHATASVLPTEQQILDIYRQKTASYSFGLPLQLGALLAGANIKEQTRMTVLAEDLGVAFQLQDDLLGMFGDEAKTGKSNVSDLREGRRTLLVVKALELATPNEQRFIKSVLGNLSANQSSLEAAKAAMINSGARDYINDLAQMHSRQAIAQLADSTLNPSNKTMLEQLIQQLMHRER